MICMNSLSNTHISTAETIHLQQEIFNCSLEEVWEKHLHPATRSAQAHKRDEIIEYAKALMTKTKPSGKAWEKKIHIQEAMMSRFKIVCEKHRIEGYKLRIYEIDLEHPKKPARLFYEHPKLLKMLDLRKTIRKITNIRFANLNWQHYEKEKE